MSMSRRKHLQLFPLQTVLYPYCILPLHIFEPRYRTMIKMCLEYDRPFGIVQISSGLEVGGRARTVDVGTIAKINNVIEFADGRMFIAVQGDKRFKILQSGYDEECLTGLVELYEDQEVPHETLGDLPDEVRRLFEKYWKLLAIVLNKDLGRIELPDEPDVLSWLIPSVLHVQQEIKQAILLKRNSRERLELEYEVLANEVENLLETIREANGGQL
jgi:Lon protease-like protein